MYTKKNLFHSARIALVVAVTAIMTLATSTHVYAQELPPVPENGTCASCHEDLYFLHDTGNWYCLREAPMQCVDCHGGNPNAIIQAEAHANRKVHPILNEDISKCQECHPEKCMDRIVKFDQVAGINDVLVAARYQSGPILSIEQAPAIPVAEPVPSPAWFSFLEIFVLVMIAGLTLAAYFVRKTQHKCNNKKEQ